MRYLKSYKIFEYNDEIKQWLDDILLELMDNNFNYQLTIDSMSRSIVYKIKLYKSDFPLAWSPHKSSWFTLSDIWETTLTATRYMEENGYVLNLFTGLVKDKDKDYGYGRTNHRSFKIFYNRHILDEFSPNESDDDILLIDLEFIKRYSFECCGSYEQFNVVNRSPNDHYDLIVENIDIGDADTMARYQIFDGDVSIGFGFYDMIIKEDVSELIKYYNQTYNDSGEWGGGPVNKEFTNFFKDKYNPTRAKYDNNPFKPSLKLIFKTDYGVYLIGFSLKDKKVTSYYQNVFEQQYNNEFDKDVIDYRPLKTRKWDSMNTYTQEVVKQIVHIASVAIKDKISFNDFIEEYNINIDFDWEWVNDEILESKLESNKSSKLRFKKKPRNKGAKTDVYDVIKGDTTIGQIKWYSRLRGYGFLPTSDCDSEIKSFIKDLMAERRKSKK